MHTKLYVNSFKRLSMTSKLENLQLVYDKLSEAKDNVNEILNNLSLEEMFVEPFHETHQNLNILLDFFSKFLLETSHIDSFLQNHDTSEINTASFEYQSFLVKCQTLSQEFKEINRRVLEWTVKMKQASNDAKYPIPSASEETLEVFSKSPEDEKDLKDSITSKQLEEYQIIRGILKEIHQDLLFLDPSDMTNTSGRRLDVMEGKALFLETEHEMNVFMDYCLFQYYKNGKNIPQRYYNLHHFLYSGVKLDILKILKNARFSLLKIIEPVEESGIKVYDRLKDETYLMIDKGLHQTAKRNEPYAILTHYLEFPNFIITTGASTPILLTTEIGQEIWNLFINDLVPQRRNETTPAYKQAITDLYKLAIHNDLLKIVGSRDLPMNLHQMNKNTFSGN